MNLLTAPIKHIATLVVSGNLQIDEIPMRRRSKVGELVRGFALKTEVEPVEQDRKAELTALTVKELLEIAHDHKSIIGEYSMRKAQLIEAILNAEGE